MEEVLGELLDLITSNGYAQAILILLMFILGAWILLYFFKHVLEHLARKNKSSVDDRIVIKMETPLVIIMILVGLQLASRKILSNGAVFETFLNTVMVVIITVMSVSIVNIVIKYWVKNRKNHENKEFHQEVQPLVMSLSKILIIAIGIIVILQMWGVQVGTTLASLGILGVILGFAFQDTMKNIFGGISLIVDNSIHKKDVIRLDTGEMGEVVEVNLRSTKIKTFDNEYLIIPNGLLSNSKIINLAEPTSTLRIDIPVSVAYGSDPEHVKTTLLSVLKGHEQVLKFPKREVRFIKMNEFSMDFLLLFFISDYRQKFMMEDLITTAVYNALREENISIPFPSRTIYQGKELNWKTKKTVNKPAKKSKKQS